MEIVSCVIKYRSIIFVTFYLLCKRVCFLIFVFIYRSMSERLISAILNCGNNRKLLFQ